MDDGRAASPDEAMGMLRNFGLNVCVGAEIRESRDHQVALLTLVNAARRTLLGGIRVIGPQDAPLLVSVVKADNLASAVHQLGGAWTAEPAADWPSAIIGTVAADPSPVPAWQLTWDIWRGGVTPARDRVRLPESGGGGLAPVLAASICAAEAFAYHAADHVLAGKRSAGLSLWRPTQDWLSNASEGPSITFLPSDLWLIGLGNLGQAYLWLLGCLNYHNPNDLMLMLQDTDRLAPSNDSTSMLTQDYLIGEFKTRALAEWCELRGFRCALEERLFGAWSRRAPHEPTVALCGVDNAHARASLENAGFGLVIETGLGAGPQSFKNLSLHAFPSSLNAARLWGTVSAPDTPDVLFRPAYATSQHSHLDECGLTQLASRTVGVPFVGLISGCFATAELLRRLHGGDALELVALSTVALEDIEISTTRATTYGFGYAPAVRNGT